jgi:hypothetical protein
MPADISIKIEKSKYELCEVTASFILLKDQIWFPAFTSSPTARKRKAREVGSEGGMTPPPYINGDTRRYAMRKSKEVKATRKGNAKVIQARVVCWAGCENVNMNDNAQAKKQIAVDGDMCPTGKPFRVLLMEKPRCSIRE